MTRRHRFGSGRRYEELLDGSRPDGSPLSAVLDAARAPGTRDEMAGLPGARTAFMSVPYVRSRPAASVSNLPAATRTAAGRLLALKFIAGVSGATLVGGAAYAATGAKFLDGSSHPHKHTTSTSAPRQGGGGHRAGDARPAPGAPLPTPATRPTDAGAHGKASVARSEHPPSKPATPPGRTHTPGPANSHSPTPHPTPTPHDTNPHHTPSPGPHTTPASAHEDARPRPIPSATARP